MDRHTDLIRFYALLDALEQRVGGKRQLAECNGRMLWPKRGMYFFFEAGEERSDSGGGLRVVRVGTHALTTKSRTTLWNRLSQHRGVEKNGGGHHRGSIFRSIIGSALKRRDHLSNPQSWGIRGSLGQAARRLGTDSYLLREEEMSLEIAVSEYIRSMPFLWLAVDDVPGKESSRGFIERNSISLLSNFQRSLLDPPSDAWLGHCSDREKVRQSGLWNNNHVEERHDPKFLNAFERFIEMA